LSKELKKNLNSAEVDYLAVATATAHFYCGGSAGAPPSSYCSIISRLSEFLRKAHFH
jgi:hypothetical protein